MMRDFSLLKQITDLFPFYFFVCGADGKVLYSKGAEIYGILEEELLGMDVFTLQEKGLIDRPSAAAESLKTGKPVTRYMTSRINVHMLVYSEPIFDKNGNVEMVYSFTFDENFFDMFVAEINRDRSNLEDTLRYITDKREEEGYLESKNSKLSNLYQIAKLAAQADSSVSIYGESGTGKEILAHFIHKNGLRVRKPFIPVNCAAIPSELIESEFFGYSKHAFTGANAKGKIGLFEMAHKGTLFLDEIGELPLGMQSKLLRAIETGEIRRVGDTEIIQTDVRIITATNRNLLELVQNRLFREDLYYRINVISLELPPLRERPEDILPLAEYFLDQWNRKHRTQRHFGESMRHYFLNYDWPGNIREMKNLIERLCIITKTDTISHDAASTIVMPIGAMTNPAPEDVSDNVGTEAQDAGPNDGLKQAVRDFEKSYIKTAINQCGGNMSAAAKQLGIHRSQLYKIINKPGYGSED